VESDLGNIHPLIREHADEFVKLRAAAMVDINTFMTT
jgi:hypothetical protein